tara:strand:+ start:344 stop:739 length:396 start_codon:yes stop_codon:yes gene_type:complete
MVNFFSKYKIVFYSINFFLIFLYLFPGSLLGYIIYNDISTQPQITLNFIISSNHFYAFVLIAFVGFLTFIKLEQNKYLIIYLISLSIILELFHLIIPARSFQWSDLFGNLFGVIIVILINHFIKKYEFFKK